MSCTTTETDTAGNSVKTTTTDTKRPSRAIHRPQLEVPQLRAPTKLSIREGETFFWVVLVTPYPCFLFVNGVSDRAAME